MLWFLKNAAILSTKGNQAHPMNPTRITLSSIFPAVQRARIPILTIAMTYFLALLVGMVMAHTGVALALDARDSIVGQAYSGSDATINALQNGQPLQAAVSDFGNNLLMGAVPSTVTGLGVIFPYPLAAYRGWVGGIVSVDGKHVSRLAQPGEAIYYLVTLLLQLIPYSLAGGAGVHLGLAYYRSHSRPQGPKWYQLPRPELLDVARIYLLVVPLFLVASLWEFLAR
jgi:uncharacterized membrane protein SpoIIM required for sporulation